MNIKLKKGARSAEYLGLSYSPFEPIVLEVAKDATSAPFEEGILIAAFDKLCRNCESFRLITLIDPIESKQELFHSLLGLRLLNAAASLLVGTQKENLGDTTKLNEIKSILWNQIRGNRGVIESGHHRYFISRDPDYIVPQELSPSLTGEFPAIEFFNDVISRHIVSMVGTTGALEEYHYESIGSFVYEAARNAHEHGRHDVDGNLIPGYRGIVLERMRVGTDRVGTAPQGFDLEYEQYLQSFGGWARDKHFVGISVVDAGLGIHKTVKRIDGEKDDEVLDRAFQPSVSRKPQGDVGRGLGLTNILRSVKQCQGFLSVHSAGLLTSTWYSNIPVNIDATHKLSTHTEKINTDRGTTLTFVFPVEKPRRQ
jgi:hypothetical protein